MEEDLLKMSGVSAGSIAILLLIYRILKSMKGKRFISVCCQRKIDMGFDVGTVETPKEQNNPMIVIDGTTRKHNPEREQTKRQEVQTIEV
jgi:hypothetical protein